jgi:hypothetical protein
MVTYTAVLAEIQVFLTSALNGGGGFRTPFASFKAKGTLVPSAEPVLMLWITTYENVVI